MKNYLNTRVRLRITSRTRVFRDERRKRERMRLNERGALTMGHGRWFTRVHAPLQTVREIATCTRRITRIDVAELMNEQSIYIELAGNKRLAEVSKLTHK